MSALKNPLYALAFLLLAGPPQVHAQQQADGVFGSPFHFTETTGRAIYQSVCAGCHMPDGRGATGAAMYPSLRHNPRLAAPGYPIAVILGGQKAMPPFARTLTDRQIAEVVDYIRHDLDNNHPGDTTPEDIKTQR
jgi:mono/diheme cytochrome c family protein